MRSARWHTTPVPYETIRTLANALGSSDILATVLASRGYRDPGAAKEFLTSSGGLHDPFLFPDMPFVCERIQAAIQSGEEICVHGDYDVDGVTSAALLVNVLGRLGAKTSWHLPDRFKEGYGIALETVEALAAAGTRLLVTVDCGIGAREQLERARELGMDAIVIDHHQPLEDSLPRALFVSPLLCDYPFKDLAGVGLAFKVAQALIGNASGDSGQLPDFLQEQLDLVALGTVADVVPLVGENRTLVKRGLPQLARTQRPGLTALMKQALVQPSRLNTGVVAFRLAPRLNAAGRLENPRLALELLLAEDEAGAYTIAAHLESLNRERQRIENEMLADAQGIVAAMPDSLRAARGYVLSAPGWHEGVIGIVAARMVELHSRPVILITETEELGKGSGRSIPAFDLHGALKELENNLEAFGGHQAACGLMIRTERIAQFQQAFGSYANHIINEDDLSPTRSVDALVSGRELTLDLVEELARMEPFGTGNPSVNLLAPGARMLSCRATRDGRHLQCQVEAGGARSSAIGFGQGHLAEKMHHSYKWDVVFHLEQNEYKGSVAPQLKLRDFYPHEHEKNEDDEPCFALCGIDCVDRLHDAEFWQLLKADEIIPRSWLSSGQLLQKEKDLNLDDRVIDRRNRGGIHGLVTMLASCGENMLLLTADVARRRRLVTEELSLARQSATNNIFLASSRCGRGFIEKTATKACGARTAIMLADYATVAENPSLAAGFNHLVFIDPPLSRTVFLSIAAAATQAFLHLFYCADEVQFTKAVLEHEYQLRDPLKKVYRHLKAGDRNPLNETTERLLLSGGRFIRQPRMVASCLKILEELNLVQIMEEGADTGIVLRESGNIALEGSLTYRQTNSFYKECSSYLSKSLNEKMT